MPRIFGLSVDEFVEYHPTRPSIAISFANRNDCAYNPTIYRDLLPRAYRRYLYTLVLNVDDVTSPADDCQIFTKAHAQNILDLISTFADYDVIIHCNAGISRTGSVVKFLMHTLNYTSPQNRQYTTNSLIYHLLTQTYLERKSNFNGSPQETQEISNAQKAPQRTRQRSS